MVQLPAVDAFGPEMRKCTDPQKKFVLAMLDLGGQPGCFSEAYVRAGYSATSPQSVRVNASRLAHNPKIINAMAEESRKRLDGSAMVAVSTLVKICADAEEKTGNKLKAALAIMDRTGLHAMSEHKVTVDDHRTEGELVAAITAMAQRQGLDPRLLLGDKVQVIDTTYEEVPAQEDSVAAGQEHSEMLPIGNPLEALRGTPEAEPAADEWTV